METLQNPLKIILNQYKSILFYFLNFLHFYTRTLSEYIARNFTKDPSTAHPILTTCLTILSLFLPLWLSLKLFETTIRTLRKSLLLITLTFSAVVIYSIYTDQLEELYYHDYFYPVHQFFQDLLNKDL